VNHHHGVSPREHQLLQELARGASTREAAAALGISEQTAKTHRRNLQAKLGTHTAGELMTRARDLGLLPPQARPLGPG
jgi:DNA-binding CsgD family transcriptional regulator